MKIVLFILLIIVTMIFVPPLGMFLLGLKLRQNRKKTLERGKILLALSIAYTSLFFLFCFIDYKDLTDFIFSMYLFGASGIIAFIMSLFMLVRGRKEKKYTDAVTKHTITPIEDISKTMHLPKEIVLRDLLGMISYGIFPGAKIDLHKNIFILNTNIPASDKTANKSKTIRCEGCGATATAFEGKGTVCEYCGAPVNY